MPKASVDPAARAVVYARYSTELQRTASIEDQIRVCRERIEREGWTYLHAYHDRAMSGTSHLRPGYQKLLDEAQRDMFDVVVAEALDRLSRDQEHVAHLYKRLSFLGIRLVTVSEGLISELHVGLSGTMGALYIKQLAEKTHRGLRGRVESGRSGGGNCYGYDVVRKAGAGGELEVGLRSVNQREAKVIRGILQAYVAGESPRSIAKGLNRSRIPGPSGGTWGPSAINGNAARGTGILNNELYIGKLVWNRLKFVKNPQTSRRQSRFNPRNAWIMKEVPELRIVTQDLWDAVKARQAQMARATRPDRKKEDFWKHQRPRHLLSGLMKCGVCGANYTKYGAHRFACAGARDRATCTNRLTVRGDEVENAILHGLKSRLMEPALFEEFAREFITEVNRSRSEASSAKAALQHDVERVDRQIKRLVDVILDGGDAQAINAKLKELEAEKSRLTRALEASSQEEPLLHPHLATIYRARVDALDALFRDPDQGRAAFDLLRGLIDEVRIVPEDEAYQIELKGELAGILALAQGAKSAEGPATQKALQIKMVAGARITRYRIDQGSTFEKITFRLAP
jgi:DNA invertase Pin-like site-specific DNA recombinase